MYKIIISLLLTSILINCILCDLSLLNILYISGCAVIISIIGYIDGKKTTYMITTKVIDALKDIFNQSIKPL